MDEGGEVKVYNAKFAMRKPAGPQVFGAYGGPAGNRTEPAQTCHAQMNPVASFALSFVPYVGQAIDVYDFIVLPDGCVRNYGEYWTMYGGEPGWGVRASYASYGEAPREAASGMIWSPGDAGYYDMTVEYAVSMKGTARACGNCNLGESTYSTILTLTRPAQIT